MGAGPDADALLEEQARLLRCIASERGLDRALQRIAEALDRLLAGRGFAVLVTSARAPSGRKHFSAQCADRWREALATAAERGVAATPCDYALSTGQPISCTDIAHDETWAMPWRAACLDIGVRACHAQPVDAGGEDAVAAVCFGYPEARASLAWEGHLARFAANLVAMVMDRDRMNLAERDAKIHPLSAQHPLDDLIEEAPFGVFTVDSRLRITRMNRSSQAGAFRAVRPLMGRALEEVMHLMWSEAVTAEIMGRFRHTLETGEPYRCKDFVRPRKDTEAVEAYEWQLRRIRLPDSGFGVLCHYFDATEVRSAKVALERSEATVNTQLAELQAIYARAPVGMCLFDRHMRYVRVNAELAAINGLSVEEHLGRTLREVVPALADQAEALLQRILHTKRSERIEFQGTTASQPGVHRWWDEHWFPILDPAGEAVAVAAVVIEVTAERRALQALQESEQRFRIALDHTPVLVYGTDSDLRYTWLYNNPSRFAQYEPIGKRDDDLLPLKQVADLISFKQEVLASGRRGRREIRFPFPEGVEYWDVSAEPLHDAHGSSTGLMVAAIDVTERRLSELAIEQSEAEARLLQRLSGELIAGTDVEAIHERVLDAAIGVMEADCASLQSVQPAQDGENELVFLAGRGLTADSARAWQRVCAGGVSTCALALRSGQRVAVADVESCGWMRGTAELRTYREMGIRAIQMTPLVSREGVLVGMLSTCWEHVHEPTDREVRLLDVIARQAADVIERGRTERALRESERRERDRASLLITIMNTSPMPIWVALDRDCRQIIGNPAGDALLQAPTGANVCMPASADSAYSYRVFSEGKEVAAEMLPMQRAAREGIAVYDYEMEVLRADGSRLWLLVHASPLWQDGNVRGAVAVGSDITARRQGEQALLDAARRKDEFLAALAHELRNPLAPIRNALEVQRRAKGDWNLVDTTRATMERQLSHMVRLVDDLLDVSRITRDRIELQPVRVRLADVIDQAVEACRPELDKAGHRLTVQLPHEEVTLWADPVRLVQILVNLLNNACKFTPSGGTVFVSAAREDKRVVVRVRDTGQGIDAALMPGIFELFVQGDHALGRPHTGLGIGLSLVKRLVELHGGTVTAKSEGRGLGCEFVITLPLHAGDPPLAVSAQAPEASPHAPAQRILVVEDNVDSAESLRLLLSLEGHQVQVAVNAEVKLDHLPAGSPK
jgi:PAS domain S-box-containing protein